MPYYCTVPRCTSMAGKAKNVSFHQFPRDEEMAKLWNDILKRGKPYTKYSKVCSLHFTSADYTITSVGKNKGQWRTLRKDAIPSRNLPSESPAPSRVRSSSSLSNTTQVDPLVQQHVAHAIYMQTMLAMQANTEGSQLPTESSTTKENTLSEFEKFLKNRKSTNIKTEPLQSDSDNETLHGDPFFNDDKIKKSYKCDECSKCFKDPDVFFLHQRTHNKTRNEKENVHLNPLVQQRIREETLKSNPILANLLKSNLAPNQNFSDQFNNINSTILSLENHIVASLSANMEEYIQNLRSMLTSQNSGNIDSSDNELLNDKTVEKLVIIENDDNSEDSVNDNSNSNNPGNSDNESTYEETEKKFVVLKEEMDIDEHELENGNSNLCKPSYSYNELQNEEMEAKIIKKEKIDDNTEELENNNINSGNSGNEIKLNKETGEIIVVLEEVSDLDTSAEIENENNSNTKEKYSPRSVHLSGCNEK